MLLCDSGVTRARRLRVRSFLRSLAGLLLLFDVVFILFRRFSLARSLDQVLAAAGNAARLPQYGGWPRRPLR